MKLTFWQEQAIYAAIIVAMALAAGWYGMGLALSVAP